nr:ribosomal protein S16 [Sauvagesia rhodoleuca]
MVSFETMVVESNELFIELLQLRFDTEGNEEIFGKWVFMIR